MNERPYARTYQRQIRRHIQAPVHPFAAIVPPPLASFCGDEARDLELAETSITEAGVEFRGKLSDCYRANLWLRTASRILCRLSSFRAGAAEELFHKVSAIRWELWLNPDIPLQVQSHVERSRIQHEGHVKETMTDGIQRRFRSQCLSPPETSEASSEGETADSPETENRQRVFVRLVENQCEISLDTTGPHLHRRGYRLQHTGAPLRETLAAAILLKAGWQGDCPLVDGMCGAGTAAIEAALMARHLPPGLNRSFLFEKWPSFQSKTWDYLRKKAREGASPFSPFPIIGLDKDPYAVAVAARNADRAGVAGDIRWENMDFFDFYPSRFHLKPGILFLDPPYGIRLSGGGEELYTRLGSHVQCFFKGWHIVVLVPGNSLAIRLGIKPIRFWRIVHGGNPVLVALARI